MMRIYIFNLKCRFAFPFTSNLLIIGRHFEMKKNNFLNNNKCDVHDNE